MRAEALRRMNEAEDSLVKYNYLSLTLKTYLMTSQIDSAWLVLHHIQHFAARQPFSPQVADLQSECLNMAGNLFARTGVMDSAKKAFQSAYEYRLKGTRIADVPDILMNLADACNRLAELDLGLPGIEKLCCLRHLGVAVYQAYSDLLWVGAGLRCST